MESPHKDGKLEEYLLVCVCSVTCVCIFICLFVFLFYFIFLLVFTTPYNTIHLHPPRASSKTWWRARLKLTNPCSAPLINFPIQLKQQHLVRIHMRRD